MKGLKKMTVNEKALKLHEEWQGKIETVSKCPIKTREDLALANRFLLNPACKNRNYLV